MAEKPGRPRVLIRRHVLEVKEDTRDWIEEQLERFTDRRTFGKTGRVVGAGIAAAGIYVMVRLINEFGRGVVDVAKNIATDVLHVGAPLATFFSSLFGVTTDVGGALEAARVHDDKESAAFFESVGGFDPFAFGAALTAGGMVLAGQNPGEILKGIGSIIDALIPL